MKTEKLFLSVIIITKNRLEVLKSAIGSLLNQSLEKKHYEIIVMDQSTDLKSQKYIYGLDIGEKANIKYIYNKILGSHSSRNIGAKKAEGDILVFIDDDVIACKNYLKVIYDSFINNSDVVLMTGKVSPMYMVNKVPEWINFFWTNDNWGRYLLELGLLDLGSEFKEISPNLIFEGNCMIRKDIFYKYKGWNPDAFSKKMIRYSGNSQTTLSFKVKKDRLKVVYNPDAKMKHLITKERLTPGYFYYRNYIEGIRNSYDDIRKTGKRLPPKQILRDFYILFKNVFKILIRFYSKPCRINFICALNRFKGKMQHKLWVLKDKKLFEFILRENYFDNGMIF